MQCLLNKKKNPPQKSDFLNQELKIYKKKKQPPCLTCYFTSLEVPWAGVLTGVRGLVTETGLVKAESRPEKCKPTLVSLPLGFHGPGYKKEGKCFIHKCKMTQLPNYNRKRILKKPSLHYK